MKENSVSRISRRDFLKISAVVCGSATLYGLFKTRPLIEVQETRVLMGTVINLTVLCDRASQGRAVIRETFREMYALEGVLSRFMADSQLSRLNTEGELVDPHPALVEVISRALEISEWTQGAYDVTVKPVFDLYQKRDSGPEPIEIAAALSQVGYQELVVDQAGIRFTIPGMSLTLDGIAKGYIVDQGVAVLRQRGYGHILVEAGGDLLAGGSNGQTPWSVGIRSPRGEGILKVLDVTNRAVATSGDYQQAYSDDFRNHHILDPRVGISPRELSSVTVIADTCQQADALATGMMVLGSKQSLKLAEKLPGVEAVLVSKDLEILTSSGVPG